LSKFLFDHVKTQVDFNTIEGKTLFLEKVSALIALVTYDAYQEQLLEGTSQVVGNKNLTNNPDLTTGKVIFNAFHAAARPASSPSKRDTIAPNVSVETSCERAADACECVSSSTPNPNGSDKFCCGE
jgi:hypothetical protein